MLSRAEIKRLRGLARSRGREETGLFLVEGVRAVEDLLDSDIVLDTVLVSPSLEDTERGRRLSLELVGTSSVRHVTESVLNEIAGTETPQGVVAAAVIPRATLADANLDARPLLVVLDAVQDPGNFGTVVRSADAFGAALVAVLPGTVDPWNPKSVRSTAGSAFRVPIVETTLDELTAFLAAADCPLLGADTDGDAVHTVTPGRAALALGNEGAGLSADVRAACAGFVSVPIRGGAESLNVGVAAGILMYALTRGRE